MTGLPNFSQGNFVPEQIDLPEDEQEFISTLKTTLETHALTLNRKDMGQYETTEVQVNQTFPGSDPQSKKFIYRKLIEFGPLPNATSTSIPHGISNISNGWFFTRIYGTARQPAGAPPLPLYIPIPNGGPTYPVEVWVDTVNVTINSSVNLSAFTSCFIVLEYYKE